MGEKAGRAAQALLIAVAVILAVGGLAVVGSMVLLVIGLKFLLRILLILTGRVKVDLDSAHADEELAHAQERRVGLDED